MTPHPAATPPTAEQVEDTAIGYYAPGRYMCRCVHCGGTFQGDKRAHCCRGCAIRLAALAPAERAEAVPDGFEEAVRLCEVGEYLYSAKAYSYGNGYDEPREYGIDWQWQQSKPGEYGQGVLLAEAVKWHEDQAADGTITEAGKLRAYIASPPAPTRASALDAAGAASEIGVGSTITFTGRGVIINAPNNIDDIMTRAVSIRDEYRRLRKDALDQTEFNASQGNMAEVSEYSTAAERHGAALLACNRIIAEIERIDIAALAAGDGEQ